MDGHSPICTGVFAAVCYGWRTDKEDQDENTAHAQQAKTQQQSAAKPQAQKLKPKRKAAPLVKANPPIDKARSTGGASQEVDYFAATPNGNQSKGHVLSLSEKFIGAHPDANICSPACVQKDPYLIGQGEFEDEQAVLTGKPYSVERRWSVDGQPAKVLDPNNNAYDYEILHQSTDNNPAFQIEYKNDPN